MIKKNGGVFGRNPKFGSVSVQEIAGNLPLSGGNLVIQTVGKGVDFSADPSAAGMVSELLDDYEEGTWTPTDDSGAGLTFTNTSNNCFYTKVGRIVTASFSLTYPSTANGDFARVGGLPFNAMATTDNPNGGYFTEQSFSAGATMSIAANGNSFLILTSGTVSIGTNANLSTKTLRGVVVYQV